MEIELNGAKLRVYEDGKIEKWFEYKSVKKIWKELKGTIHIDKKNDYKSHRTKIDYKLYITSRVIYFAFNQTWDITDNSKINTIDHIDRNSLNNHINNLRVATMKEQVLNRDFKNAKGYNFYQKNWKSQIRINGKIKHLGCFDTEEEASKAYQDAKSTHISYII